MLSAFLLQNLHFAINIFVAMVFSWCFWLYWDVWRARKSSRNFLKFMGFALLALSFLTSAIGLETSVFNAQLIAENSRQLIMLTSRIAGYLLLAVGVYLDPILAHPKYDSEEKEDSKLKSAPVFILTLAGVEVSLSALAYFSLPILSVMVGLLYLYKATIGFEYHLRKVAYSFFGISLYELLSLGELFRNSTNVSIYNLVTSFSPYWYLTHLVLVVSAFVLGKWVFSYLLKRIETQLYIFFSVAVLLIFIISTASFTYFLLGNVQKQALSQLEVSARVLDYALSSSKQALQGDAKVFSDNPSVLSSLNDDQKSKLAALASDYLVSRKLRSLVVTNINGQIQARGEEPERIGGSISGNSLFQRGVAGQSVSSVTSREGVLGPDILLSSVSPVDDGGDIKGVVMASVIVDDAFLDGVQKATGLSVSIYGGNKISATTLTAEDGHTRRVGIVESNQEIISKVLGRGEYYLGEHNFLNTPYFAAFLPLKDIDDVPVAMIFVGEPQVAVLETAGHSIQGSFAVAGILWFLAIVPSYLIAAYISKQLK